MTDRLGMLLDRTADDWCRDAQPPPLLLPGPGPRRARRRSSRVWAPVLAAAAVVAVIVPVVTVAQRGTRQVRPLEQVGEPVPVEQGPALRFRPTDAALPAAAGFAPPADRAADCTAQQLTAVLDLAAGRLHIAPVRRQVCLLPADLQVTVPAPATVVRDEQPDVPNPPEFNGRFLQSYGVDLNTEWTGRCDALPLTGALTGVGLTVPFTVEGTPTRCGTGEPVLRVGPTHSGNGPGGIVPADRTDLDVSLQLPAEVSTGAEFTYQVTVANPTDHDVSLRPCPTYASTYRSKGGGGGGYGRLPCDRLPGTLGARQQIAVLVTEHTWTAGPAKVGSSRPGEVSWQIAGTGMATGSLDVVDRAPESLGTVPYLAPAGTPPAKSAFRYTSGGGAFPVMLEGPATVRVGETFRYKVVFTNPGGGPVVPLRPCPAWTELVAQAPKVTNRPKIIERTGTLNCAQSPEQVGPGEQITFEMERQFSADTPPGAYQMYWQIHNGMTSAPFDLDVLP